MSRDKLYAPSLEKSFESMFACCYVCICCFLRHGYKSLERYSEVEKSAFKKPLLLTMKGPEHKTQAFIDVDDKFNETDKLSQVTFSRGNLRLRVFRYLYLCHLTFSKVFKK